MSTIRSRTADELLTMLEASDRFLIQQVFKPLLNEYRISIPAAGSKEEGEPLLFVRQKRMKIREDIRFRVDPDQDAHVFMIKSQTVFEFAGRHDVLDANGANIGTLEKTFGKSLLRSHWRVRGAGGELLYEAQEKSLPIAIVRRVAGLVSDGVVGLLQWLPFNFTLSRDGAEIGQYGRVLGSFRDRYVLELVPGSEGIDRRLVLAFAIALDALQDR